MIPFGVLKKVTLLIVFLVPVLFTSTYFWQNLSFFTPQISVKSCLIANKGNNTLVVGDSWTQSNSFRSGLQSSTKRQTDFLSYPGQTSKSILKSITENEVLLKELHAGSYQQVLVVAGVNDLAGGFGQDYYAHHIYMLNQYFKQFCVKTSVLELPYFHMNSIKRGALSKIKHAIFSWLMQKETDNLFSSYRLTAQKYFASSDVLIPYPQHLLKTEPVSLFYRDPAHLNEEGSKVLSQWIMYHLHSSDEEEINNLPFKQN